MSFLLDRVNEASEGFGHPLVLQKGQASLGDSVGSYFFDSYKPFHVGINIPNVFEASCIHIDQHRKVLFCKEEKKSTFRVFIPSDIEEMPSISMESFQPLDGKHQS
ncbi:MAG: hypothetical protein R3A11_06755 [Bdellovibrionota bacterium]